MAIQMRRGLRRDFDPAKMLPGEWAVTTDPGTENQIVYMCFQAGVVKRMGTYEDFKEQVREATEDIKEEYEQTFNEIKVYMEGLKRSTEGYKNTAEQKAAQASNSATQAGKSASGASVSATNAADSADASEDYSKQAKSYAKGTGGEVRPNDDTDCAEYYYEQTKRMAQGVNGMIPMGTITFAELPASDILDGAFYNIRDGFVSDERFTDGGGVTYGPGNNVYWIKVEGKWDVTASSSVTGVKGAKETSYRQGNVSLSAGDIGAVEENGDVSENTVTFEEAVERAGVLSGDSMSVAFGKLAKYCSDLETQVLGGLRAPVQEQIDGQRIFNGVKVLSTIGWYRVFEFTTNSNITSEADVGIFGDNFLLQLSTGYNNSRTESCQLAISLGYGREHEYNILSLPRNTAVIDQVRITYGFDKNVGFLEIHYGVNVANTVSYRLVHECSIHNNQIAQALDFIPTGDSDGFICSSYQLQKGNTRPTDVRNGFRNLAIGDANINDYFDETHIGSWGHYGGTLSGLPDGVNGIGIWDTTYSIGDGDGKYLMQTYHPYDKSIFVQRMKNNAGVSPWATFYPGAFPTYNLGNIEVPSDVGWGDVAWNVWNKVQNSFNWNSVSTPLELIVTGIWINNSWFTARFFYNINGSAITGYIQLAYMFIYLYWGPLDGSWDNVIRNRINLYQNPNLKGPFTCTLTESFTMPTEGYKYMTQVSTDAGKPVLANFTRFQQMSGGAYNVQIDFQNIYIVANPGTVVPANPEAPVIITYFCV